MCQINENYFLGSLVDSNILQNITRYCSECYTELQVDDKIYLYQETYNYLCKSCACKKSEELQAKEETLTDEYEEEGGGLF